MKFPGFLHNLGVWLATHAEGVKQGTADEAEIEASPVVQEALQVGENAARDYFLGHVARATGIAPTPEGITGLVSDVIDGKVSLPASAKEPVKILLGGLLGGSNFLAQSAGPKGADAVIEKGPVGPVEEKALTQQGGAAGEGQGQGVNP